MKKFLRSLTLFAALLGVSLSASADACSVKNLVFNIKSYTTNPDGTCTMVFDIGWDQLSNNGSEYSIVHLWLADDYPTTSYSKPLSPAQLNNSKSFGTIVINGGVITNQYPSKNGAGSPIILMGNVIRTTSSTAGYRYLIENVSKTFANCPTDMSIKGDIWASNSNQGNVIHCIDAGLTFLPPAQDLNVSGTLDCGYKNGYPDNKINVSMTSGNASTLPVIVSYDVYVDNGDGSFSSTTDTKVADNTVNGISVHTDNPYNAGPISYAPNSNQYAYLGSSVWIVATANITSNAVVTQFTRLYKIVNTCTVPAPAPVATNDNFPETSSNIIKGNVFGNNIRWANELGTDSEFKLSVASGIDNDLTDPALSSMTFTKIGTTVYNGCSFEVPQDLLIFNSNGTFEINRGDLSCIEQVTFQYEVTNNITKKTSEVVTVSLEFAQQSTLPVTYASFTAKRTNSSQVILEWETAMEEANRGFHVQRNIDGTWKNIAFVFSQADGGNSRASLKYGFKDANSSKGISQYRILQVDIDGKGKYSQIRSVHGQETAAARITLFPNPSSTGSFTLLFDDASSVRDVTVTDVSGRSIKQYKGVSSNSLAVAGLKSGFYTVQVANRTTGTTAVEKVIVK